MHRLNAFDQLLIYTTNYDNNHVQYYRVLLLLISIYLVYRFYRYLCSLALKVQLYQLQPLFMVFTAKGQYTSLLLKGYFTYVSYSIIVYGYAFTSFAIYYVLRVRPRVVLRLRSTQRLIITTQCRLTLRQVFTFITLPLYSLRSAGASYATLLAQYLLMQT